MKRLLLGIVLVFATVLWLDLPSNLQAQGQGNGPETTTVRPSAGRSGPPPNTTTCRPRCATFPVDQ